MNHLFVYATLCLIVSEINFIRCQDYDEYDYGDPSYHYDSVHMTQQTVSSKGGVPGLEPPVPPQAVRGAGGVSVINPALPLCCKEGEVFDYGRCIIASLKISWKPKLDGAIETKFHYRGFPKCQNRVNPVSFYQKEVHFNLAEGSVLLPFYIQTESVKQQGYCVTKVTEDDNHKCEDFQTQIFACIREDEGIPHIVWVSLSISHILLILTLLAFFFMSDLRCLQGQYMICFVISVLIYNMCLLPGSSIMLNVGDSMCIALGAVKYFFFCGIFLWFKVICYDVWRTIRIRQDISGRKRFLFYSIYSWIVGAVFTVAVLVLPYTKAGSDDNTRIDPLREANYDGCKLKMGVDLILQIAQTLSMLTSFVFLIMASVYFYGYNRFGNGLPRHDAFLCMKQTWKLFFLMVAHVLSSVDKQFMQLPVPMYQYVLLESVTIFGVFAYRKAVMRWVMRGACFTRWIFPLKSEEGNNQEKGQLTMT